MTAYRLLPAALLTVCLFVAGCRLPGKPSAGDTPLRPDQVSDFKTLYAGNCAACHGAGGHNGVAVSLANPAYLAYAGEDNIAAVTANGIDGSLMPAFAKSSGGLLTDAQIRILAHGMISEWSNPAALHGGTPPPYYSSATGDPARGEQVYRAACLQCHADARGSLLDPAYLALISEGGLRTLIVAGKPEQGMPDWEDLKTGPLTDQNIADVVSFLFSHRATTPGQPFASPRTQPANPLGTPRQEQP